MTLEKFDGVCEAERRNGTRCPLAEKKEKDGYLVCGAHARHTLKIVPCLSARRFRAVTRPSKVCTHPKGLELISANPPLVQCKACLMYLDLDLAGFTVTATPIRGRKLRDTIVEVSGFTDEEFTKLELDLANDKHIKVVRAT